MMERILVGKGGVMLRPLLPLLRNIYHGAARGWHCRFFSIYSCH